MAEKLTATVTFHCTEDTKRLISGLASVDGSDSSNWLRELVEREIEARRVKAMMQYDLFGLPQKQERF
jgi:hypothetical protein